MTNVHAGTNRWNSLELYCIVNFGQLLIYMLSLFKDHAAWNMSWKNYPYPYTKKWNAEYKVQVQVIRKKDLEKYE